MKSNSFFKLLAAFIISLFPFVTVAAATPIDLTCEHLIKPIGVDAMESKALISSLISFFVRRNIQKVVSYALYT